MFLGSPHRMPLSSHPYARFLHKVEKPARYTGAEHGVRRKDWNAVTARVCLAFPDVYDIGMSHLGYRILYKILNDDPRTLAERAYTPWVDLQDKLREHGQLLVSNESARPLSDFDVVGFSLQYELTYTNVLTMLDLGGIPLRAENRSDGDPLVIAGGPVATHAEPMAAFFDAIVIGDGEEATSEVAVLWAEMKEDGIPRDERLAHLARIRGVYVPSLYETAVDGDTGFVVVRGPARGDVPFPIERRLLDDISKYPFPHDGPVGGPEAIFDRMSIEVARGCTEGCRFCQAGMIYRPVRERDPEEIVDTVARALDETGQDEVSLTALSTADVSCISPLIKRLVERTAPERVSLGVASLRAYGLADDLLDDMRRVRASGLTFAPEAGTQRMRDVVNKNVTEEQLLETAERVFSRGFDKMKLYFMIGLPTEEDEDVLGSIEVGRNALGVARRVGNQRAKVTVSVSTHVPKPHTPFQWCAMDMTSEIARKQDLLRRAAGKTRALTLRMHDCTTSVLEGVLARGDRTLGDVIEHAYLAGARFDSWEDHLRMDLWDDAMRAFGVEPARYLGTIPLTARLPWDHFDIGLEEGFLAKEYKKALRNRLSPPCGKAVGAFIHHTNVKDAEADQKKLVCYDCGVACDLTKMREERIDFLRRMSAVEPGQRARLAVAEEPPTENGKKHRRPEAYRPPRPGSPPERWRLRFEKTGPAALLGHLDLIRELPRVIRRAGVRTHYTEGFHPKPAMSYGPALSLGIASLDEYVDCKLIEAPDPRTLIARLDGAAAEGFHFVDAKRLGPIDPGLSKVVTGARYVVALADSALDELGGRDGLEARVAAFLAEESCVVRRTIKGLGKNVDVRALVSELFVGGEAAQCAIGAAGIVGRVTPFTATIAITQQGSAKVCELVGVLTGDATFPHTAVRVAMLAGASTPMDLEAHRKAPAAKPIEIAADTASL